MKRILFIMTIGMAAFICLSVAVYADDECDHEWSDWTVTGTDGKCTSYLSRECGKCHITENDTVIEHDWSSWETDYDATCAEEGLMSRDCSAVVNMKNRLFLLLENIVGVHGRPQ